jgi:hypothetical protein
MAGDWIKTRVWLCRDPKVIRMADFLAEQRRFMDWLTDPVRSSCKETAYEHVPRNVTVALCVTGLIVTWGTARERGNREADDLVLDCCALDEVSAVADIPCFGEAMEHVGWAVERADDCVVFPKFFKDNESPDDRYKRQAAERQARFREGRDNATVTVPRNVTVTDEKRREEKSNTSLRSVLEAPTEKHREQASELKLDCDAQWAAYLDHLKDRGKRSSDRGAGFRNWLRKADEFRAERLGRRPPSLAEKRAANIAVLTGRAGNERTIEGVRVGGAAVLSLSSDLREPGCDDVGGRGPERSAIGMG